MQKKSNNADLCILSSPVFYQQQDDVWQTFAVVDVPTEAPGHAQTKFSDATERHLGILNQYRLWSRKIKCFHRTGAIQRPAATRSVKYRGDSAFHVLASCLFAFCLFVLWTFQHIYLTVLLRASINRPLQTHDAASIVSAVRAPPWTLTILNPRFLL